MQTKTTRFNEVRQLAESIIQTKNLGGQKACSQSLELLRKLDYFEIAINMRI